MRSNQTRLAHTCMMRSVVDFNLLKTTSMTIGSSALWWPIPVSWLDLIECRAIPSCIILVSPAVNFVHV